MIELRLENRWQSKTGQSNLFLISPSRSLYLLSQRLFCLIIFQCVFLHIIALRFSCCIQSLHSPPHTMNAYTRITKILCWRRSLSKQQSKMHTLKTNREKKPWKLKIQRELKEKIRWIQVITHIQKLARATTFYNIKSSITQTTPSGMCVCAVVNMWTWRFINTHKFVETFWVVYAKRDYLSLYM